MYTAPPSGDENADDRRSTASETENAEDAPEREADERTSPVLEPTTATTDANWTGTVPADD